MVFRTVAVLASVTLAGCGGQVVTSPDVISIDPSRVAHIRAPQDVALSNAYAGDAKQAKQVYSPDGGSTWELDARQMTDTAIVALRRALERRGVMASQAAGKTIAMRVRIRSTYAQPIPLAVPAMARLELEAQFGDGTSTWVEGEAGSAFGVTGSYNGAIQLALYRLLSDAKFIAYMNR
jgi:hypothetical protein